MPTGESVKSTAFTRQLQATNKHWLCARHTTTEAVSHVATLVV